MSESLKQIQIGTHTAQLFITLLHQDWNFAPTGWMSVKECARTKLLTHVYSLNLVLWIALESECVFAQRQPKPTPFTAAGNKPAHPRSSAHL